jgi:hypothetical protein
MLQIKYAFVIHIEKWVLSTPNLHKENFFFEGLNIVIVEVFKFQNKMCIYMLDVSNIKNTSFEYFHLEKIQDIKL